MIVKSMSGAPNASKEQDARIADVKRSAAEYALAREPQARRHAAIANLRALWEIAASAGAPVEGLAVVNKVIQAIEDDSFPFYLGVQFHPELLIYRADCRRLFAGFVQAARNK